MRCRRLPGAPSRLPCGFLRPALSSNLETARPCRCRLNLDAERFQAPASLAFDPDQGHEITAGLWGAAEGTGTNAFRHCQQLGALANLHRNQLAHRTAQSGHEGINQITLAPGRLERG
jgi:hypothetical protein